MAELLSVENFLTQADKVPVLDVRSPGEYAQGHIPGAFSFPLFSDEERKVVGTLYKQTGKEEAFLAGLEFTGPKMAGFVRKAKALNPDRRLALYCWRGGMRSGSMAWLLQTAGFEISLLKGGYKSFRNAVLKPAVFPGPLLVLGGLTGSGKTPLLRKMAEKGAQFLDFERLANHKGSAFGSLGEPDQPTQEQFENELFVKRFHMVSDEPIWVEDESRAIGRLRIPNDVFEHLRQAPVLFLEQSRESRITRILELYGSAPRAELEESIRKLAKRLGGQRLKEALEALSEGDLEKVASLVLEYYDKAYRFGFENRPSENRYKLPCQQIREDDLPDYILDKGKSLVTGTNRVRPA